MKKNGWGTLQMLLLSGGLLLALLIAVFFISKLYGSYEGSKSNKEYADLEARIENAAALFIRLNSIEVSSSFRVDLDALQNSGLVNDFKDDLGNSCDGYVIVIKNDIAYDYEGRIKCPNYTTLNY